MTKLKTESQFINGRTLCLISLVFLCLRLGFFYNNGPRYQAGRSVSLEGTVVTEPIASYGRQMFRLGQLTVFANQVPEVHYGDRVRVQGTIGEGNRLEKSTVVLVQNYQPNQWETVAVLVRTNFINTYHNVLNKEEANLLSGVVLGSVGLDRQFKAKLANVGLTHVVAASGMNVTLFRVLSCGCYLIFDSERYIKQ